jgi:hypothetical protein
MLTPPTILRDDPAALQLIPRAALAEIELLQLQLAGLPRNRFGRRSEQLYTATLRDRSRDPQSVRRGPPAGTPATQSPDR